MTTPSISELLKERRLERVDPDVETARSKLSEARRHLESAQVIIGNDPEGAYAMLYDAARKAIDAHMLANGYRVSKNRLGAHEAMGSYALAVMKRRGSIEHVKHFDRMRRTRNRSEYGSWAIGSATLHADIEHARGIVQAVDSDLA